MDETAPTDTDSTAADAGDGSADSGSWKSRIRRPGPPIILLLVATLIAASGLVAWWQTAGDDQLVRAEQRDTVLLQARQGVEIMNTLDYRDVAGGIAQWQDVTTGTLRDQLTAVDEAEQQLLADQQKISTGDVVDAAVVELEDDRASVIASVEITVADADPEVEATVKRNRFAADLIMADGRWLIEDLRQVAVSLG
ncbi:hypothetical protein [Aeromicrobium sp. CF3.5]|uniref:hypothetical protein n=1 Tax=Aeromicrobium sp. CF3.5 TaxID=3373078 RepID=UPI003EE812B7